jgi:hypothetical protein
MSRFSKGRAAARAERRKEPRMAEVFMMNWYVVEGLVQVL